MWCRILHTLGQNDGKSMGTGEVALAVGDDVVNVYPLLRWCAKEENGLLKVIAPRRVKGTQYRLSWEMSPHGADVLQRLHDDYGFPDSAVWRKEEGT